MPVFDTATQTKIATLRTLYAAGTGIEVYELIKVNWPSPDGAIYYASTQVDEISSVAPSVSPIETRLIPSGWPASFVPVSVDSSIGDEEVDLEFWDGDEVISQLLVDHGEGVKAELFYWFPQATLLLPVWHGHLRFEDDAAVDILKLKAVQGFRSSDAMIPHRAHWQECQAIFGGVLDTQAEIDQHDCPYNRHVSGTVGNYITGTTPYTSCPRRTATNCSDRLGTSLFMLSHRTATGTVINNQTSGPRLYSVSAGNETNLKEPVRVVLGKRRAYKCPVLSYRRDANNNNPAHGFFQALYEVGEGPNKSLSQGIVTVGGASQNVIALHYAYRLGYRGQTAVSELTAHSYSGTCHFRYAYGWVNPAEVDPSEAEASIIVEGLADVYVETGDVTGGVGGLLATFYRGSGFTRAVATRIVETVDMTDTNTTAPTEVTSDEGFGVRFTGQIKPRYSETYTFTTPINDSIVSVYVNGSLVINAATYPSTGSGTIALTANTLYDIRVDLTQDAAAGYNPWGVQLKWQSTSQALEVVPSTRLYYADATIYEGQYTTNRAWHIARVLTDKRWGFGIDRERLDMTSFKAAAEWCEQTVKYTDPDGAEWDHIRSDCNVELIEKKAQQQIEDLCMAGRLSKPFLFDGKIHIVPLSALDSGELAACPVFTDTGETRNVIWENDKSTLAVSRASDLELANRVECSYDYIANDYLETPLQPVEDIDAQIAAGRVVGDKARKINPKKYSLLGVVSQAQAVKMAWSLLDLGPDDDGGLQNNLRIKFKIWFADAIDLHPYKVIKYDSTRLTKYGFEYFRIKKLHRLSDLQYEVEAQAYNPTYMDSFETDIAPIDPIDPPPHDPPICPLAFGTVTFGNDTLTVPIDPC